MAFEFGMFHEFQRPAGISDEAAFATSFEQVDAAERWGLDAMWLAEIHVAPERSVLSAPLTLASAIAARTKRIRGACYPVVPTGERIAPKVVPGCASVGRPQNRAIGSDDDSKVPVGEGDAGQRAGGVARLLLPGVATVRGT